MTHFLATALDAWPLLAAVAALTVTAIALDHVLQEDQ